MSPRARLLLAAALGLGRQDALACPCQGSAGPGAAVTRPDQTAGVSATTAGRVVHGAWDASGVHSSLAGDAEYWMIDLALIVGYRPISTLELGVLGGVVYQSLTAAGIDSRTLGFGDTTLRARWELLDEPMPHEEPVFPYPALALVPSIRAPTGALGQSGQSVAGTTGSIGSSASSQGLGAWESSLALDAQKTFGERVRVGALGEAAYRFPDASLGIDRRLGPRALVQLNFGYLASASWGAGVVTDLGWEDAVAFDGRRRFGTAQRLWSVAVYGYHVLVESGFRLGAMVRHTPLADGLSVNAVSATSLALSIGYAH